MVDDQPGAGAVLTERDVWWSIARVTVGGATRLAFRLRPSGLRHVPGAGGGLLCYNHVSILDPVAVAVSVAGRGRAVRFLTLSEEFDRPVLGWALRRLRHIPLRRGAGDWAAIDAVSRVVGSGALAGMSPEGRVGDGDRLLPGQKGAARIALTSHAPVVPIGIWGTHDRWPKAGLRLVRPARPVVAVVFGAPINPQGDARSRPDVRLLTDRIMGELDTVVSRARQLHDR
jgi:1-acyl-sn-glycerol-3-phosphate acyltransferase